jgi:hypothetical protein
MTTTLVFQSVVVDTQSRMPDSDCRISRQNQLLRKGGKDRITRAHAAYDSTRREADVVHWLYL